MVQMCVCEPQVKGGGESLWLAFVQPVNSNYPMLERVYCVCGQERACSGLAG